MLTGSAVGIDIGTTAVRIVWLKGSRGALQVAKAIRIEREADTDLSPEALVPAMVREKIPLGALILGVPGDLAALRYNLVPPVPDWRLELIMKYETQETAEKSGEPLSFDFRKLDLPESSSEDQVLLVGLGKDLKIQPVISGIEQGGGRVSLVTPNALGLYHAYAQSHAKPPSETVLLADVGAHETHIVLATDGRLVFARSVNFGGRQFDEAIAASLGVRADQARKLKESFSTGRVPVEVKSSAEAAIRSALGQLNSILHSSVTFCRAQTKIPEIKLERVLLCGGGSRIPQMAAFLEDQFGVPVTALAPAAADEPLAGGPEEWTTAIGLAASRFDASHVVLDLLPTAARVKRTFRERTRFLYAAAATLVFALLVTFGTGLVASSKVDGQTEVIEEWKRRVDGWEQEQRSARTQNGKIRAQKQALDREVETGSFAGQLLAAIEDSMPPAISLERVDTQRVEVDGRVYLETRLVGFADNSERLGIEHLTAFQKALEALPTVERVALGPPELRAGGYRFEMTVSPDAEPPPESRSGSGQRSSGKGRWGG
ncbi:MAG: pilus assembly protein PilM [Planctomycetota bacterium]